MDQNAKEEFIEQITKKHIPLCALIQIENKKIILKENYTLSEYGLFLSELEFQYDSGYGSQELYGIVWTKNGWFSRREYDGSEWWQCNTTPDIPIECQRN